MRWLPIALTLTLICSTAAIHTQISAEPQALGGESFVPRPSVAKAMSLGFDAVLADYHWLQAVQVVGAAQADPSRHATHLGRLVDVVTTLDPWVDHPYRFAAVWMIDTEANVRHANRLLRRGIAHHPDDWRGYFYLGFNHFFYLEENARAADVLEQAARLPRSPRYLPRLVARLRSESADLDAAFIFLQQLVQDAPDEIHRAEYQGALDEIEVERRARFLDAARETYRQRTGADIVAVADLSRGPQRVLKALPDAEPTSLPPGLRRGSEWLLHEESDRIVSSYYGRRYELTFHGLDAKRRSEWRERRHDQAEGARHDG